MNNQRPRISLIVFVALFAALFFVGGFFVGRDFQTITPGTPLRLEKISEVYKKLQEEFIFNEDIDVQALEYGAVKGMVDAVGDPYTYFLDPEESKDFDEVINGSFQGIGAEIGLNEQRQIIIIAPLEGTPAKAAGVKPQDIILQIDDATTADLTLDQAVANIRGPKGTTVALTILREGLLEPIIIPIVRDFIEIPIIDWKLIEGGKIAYIQLFNFNERSGNAFDEVAQQVLTSTAKHIVLDLRGNPGGILQEAVKVAGWFIDNDQIVAQEAFADNDLKPRNYISDGPARLKGFPLVVLINKGSASASEILAGALHAQNDALLIGERTFGKGTVQVLEKFSDGSTLRVTVSQWLLPDGTSINKEGLAPNIFVAFDASEENQDNQLQRAVQALISPSS